MVAERLDALERVALQKGLVTKAELHALVDDATVTAEREVALGDFIQRTLGSLREP